MVGMRSRCQVLPEPNSLHYSLHLGIMGDIHLLPHSFSLLLRMLYSVFSWNAVWSSGLTCDYQFLASSLNSCIILGI